MSLSVLITRDDVSPALARIGGALRSLRPFLEAVGLEVVSLTKQSFRDPSVRVAPWRNLWGGIPPEKGGGPPSYLIKGGDLYRSIRITGIAGTTVTVGSDSIYAAIHQLGGIIRPKTKKWLVFNTPTGMVQTQMVTIPPRPFFPIEPNGNLSSLAQMKIADALTKAIQVYLP